MILIVRRMKSESSYWGYTVVIKSIQHFTLYFSLGCKTPISPQYWGVYNSTTDITWPSPIAPRRLSLFQSTVSPQRLRNQTYRNHYLATVLNTPNLQFSDFRSYLAKFVIWIVLMYLGATPSRLALSQSRVYLSGFIHRPSLPILLYIWSSIFSLMVSTSFRFCFGNSFTNML